MTTIDDFLLGKSSLHKASVVSLLLSTSFGVNSILYASWLGYSIGAWALVIQFFWAFSFLLLRPFSEKIATSEGIHSVLGKSFGTTTKIISSICTLIGLTYLMGWEVQIGLGVAQLSLTSIMQQKEAFSLSQFIVYGGVCLTLLYTTIWGLKGNAKVDFFLNSVKLLALLTITLLIVLFHDFNIEWSTFFISFDEMVKKFGLWGFITNIIFNLCWQFVDNSTWQSIISVSQKNKLYISKTLESSGLIIFLSIGVLGTIFGFLLSGIQNLTPDNVLSQALYLTNYQELMLILLLILIVTSIMSFLDGLLLSTSYTAINDLLNKKDFSLKKQRLLVVIIAIWSVFGVNLIFKVFNLNLFDFVYILIITQLSMIGLILLSLLTDRKIIIQPWVIIIIAMVFGFGSITIGNLYNLKYLIDGAGTITTIASIFFTRILSKKNEKA